MTHLPSSGTWAGLLLGVTFLSEVSPVLAEEKPVRVTVVAILASDQNQSIDPRLKEVARQVQKLEPRLTGFTLARESSHSLPVGREHKFKLVDEEEIAVTVTQGPDPEGRVRLSVKPPRAGEIVYSCASGKYFPILTRYETMNKERLIVAIMVKPAKK